MQGPEDDAVSHRFAGRYSTILKHGLAFMAPLVATLYLALNGGSFDLVVRQQETIAVWWALGIGLAVGVIPRARTNAVALAALGCLVLVAVWAAFGFAWSSSDERTLAEIVRIALFAGTIALVLVLVDRTFWRSLVAGLTFGAVAVCGVALASRLAPDAFPIDAVADAFGARRLNYPFDYWNAVSAWGAMSLALALGWSAHASRALIRAVALAAVPVCGLAVYLAYSRAGVVDVVVAAAVVLAFSHSRWLTLIHVLAGAGTTAMAVSVARSAPGISEGTSGAGAGKVLLAIGAACLFSALVVLLTTWLRAERLRLGRVAARWALAVGAATLIGMAGIVLGPRLDDAWDDFRSKADYAEVQASDDPATRLGTLQGGRYLIWDSALRAFESEPTHGIGAGTFEFWWNRDAGEEFLVDAHSLYLEVLAELGMVGLALLLVGLILFAVAAVRVRLSIRDLSARGVQAGLLGAFAVFLVHAGVDWIWESTAVAMFGLVAVAVAASGVAEPRKIPLAMPWRIAGAVACSAVMLIALPGLSSTSLVRDSQAALRAGDQPAALRHANDAVDTEPWAATPYVQRALVAEAAGDLPAARRDLALAIEREPQNWRHRLLRARVEAQLGQVPAALATFREARRLRPASPFFDSP